MGITNSVGYNRHYRELDLIMPDPTKSSEIVIHDYSPDYQAQGDCRVCGHMQHRPWHRGMKYRNLNDDFIGEVIGEYRTREGKRGVVLEQIGTRVVHVYGLKFLTPEE